MACAIVMVCGNAASFRDVFHPRPQVHHDIRHITFHGVEHIIQKTHFCPVDKSGFLLAERKGFEPLRRYQRLHDFQSCAFDQLSHLSR